METIFKYDENNPKLMHYDLEPDAVLDTISTEMIRCNRKSISCLVPMRFITENGITSRIDFELADMMSLKSYLDKFAINKKRFAELAGKILDALENCILHMLPAEQIFLDTDNIYVDIATMKVYLICLPVKDVKEAYDLKEFVIGFIESIYLDAGFEHESADFQKIYDMIPSQDMDIEQMREDLEILMNGEKKNTSEAAMENHSDNISAASAAPIIKQQPALVDVVQESAYVSPQNTVVNSKPDKKTGILKSKTSHSQKDDKKSRKSSASTDLMSMFRKAQNNPESSVKQVQPANKQSVQAPMSNNSNSERTVLILHDDPDETAYLVYGTQKIRINAEGTSIGRLGGQSCKKVDVFLESIHVSSYHAVITYDFDKMFYTVTDYSSTGISINGARISKNVPVRINHNDLLVFGDVPCRIILESNNFS